MKSYNETVNSVFRRIEEYETVKKQKRKIFTEAGLCICCACIIAVIGIGSQRMTDKSSVSEKQTNVTVSNSTSENQNVNGFYIPANPDGQPTVSESETSPRLCPPTVYSYPCSEQGKYRAPENGEIVMSLPLVSAIEEYNDSVYYAVEILIFESETHLTEESKCLQEYERISKILNNGKLGFSVSKNSDGEKSYMLLGHISKDCLDKFPVSEKYGYFIQLSGDTDELTESFNVVNGTVSNASP